MKEGKKNRLWEGGRGEAKKERLSWIVRRLEILENFSYWLKGILWGKVNIGK